MDYQRTGIAGAVVMAAWGIYLMHTGVAAIAATDVQAISADIRSEARLNRNTYSWLNDLSANRMASMQGLSPEERSTLSFAPADLNDVPHRAFAITVSGVSEDTCENLVKLDPANADSVVVNGEVFDRGYSKPEAMAKCRMVFLSWRKNTVVISGS